MRPADLVLFGHAHRNVEYRLKWNEGAGKLQYFTDFYSETPASYYNSKRVVGIADSEPVQILIRPNAAPYGTPQLVTNPQDFWGQWKELSVPPYSDPLSRSVNVPAWWQKHRPLLIQTASLGPMDSNQRKDLELNPAKPSPSSRGIRVISVRNNVISEIRHVPNATLAEVGAPAQAADAAA